MNLLNWQLKKELEHIAMNNQEEVCTDKKSHESMKNELASVKEKLAERIELKGDYAEQLKLLKSLATVVSLMKGFIEGTITFDVNSSVKNIGGISFNLINKKTKAKVATFVGVGNEAKRHSYYNYKLQSAYLEFGGTSATKGDYITVTVPPVMIADYNWIVNDVISKWSEVQTENQIKNLDKIAKSVA